MTSSAPSPSTGRPEAAERRRDLFHLARGGAINLVGAAVTGVVGFVQAIALTHGLSVATAGVFFQVTALWTILGTVVELGVPNGIVRTISQFRVTGRQADIRPSLWVALGPVIVVAVLVSAVLGLASQPIANALGGHGSEAHNAVVYLLVLAPFLLPSALIDVLARAFQGFGEMFPLVVISNVFVPLARFAMTVIVLRAGASPWLLAVAWGAPAAVAAAVVWVWLLRRLAATERSLGAQHAPRQPRRTLAVEFWRITGFQAVATIVQIVLLRIDVLMVGVLVGANHAAVYAAASRYLTPGVMLSTAIVFVVGPQMSTALAQSATHRAQGVYRTATLWLTLFSFPIFLMLAVYSRLMMRVFGESFVAGAPALTILSIAMLVNMGTGAVRAALFMGGKGPWILLDNALALAINVALNLILIPLWGINGAAVAWTVSIMVGNLLPAIQVHRLWGLQPVGPGFPEAVIASALCFGLVGILVRAALGEVGTSFVVYMAVAVPLYAAVSWRYRSRFHLGVVVEALRPRAATVGSAGSG